MNIEKMKKIVDGAPAGATHVETVDYSGKPETFEYLKYDGACWYELINGKWLEDTSGRLCCYANIRNISDLKTIIAQSEEIGRLRELVPQWVSVSERLPPENETVLLDWPYWSDAAIIGHLIDGIFRSNRAIALDKKDGVQVNGPTHWMPLPTPPKGEGE